MKGTRAGVRTGSSWHQQQQQLKPQTKANPRPSSAATAPGKRWLDRTAKTRPWRCEAGVERRVVARFGPLSYSRQVRSQGQEDPRWLVSVGSPVGVRHPYPRCG